MTQRLDGRGAIVTGAGSGIGREIARRLHAAGAAVTLLDIDAAAVHDLAGSLGPRALAQVADVTDEAQVEAAVAAAVEAFGPPRIGVNSAGTGGFGPHQALSRTGQAVRRTGPLMEAAITTGTGITVVEVPEPVPGPGQVLAAPLATGICGSDLHLEDALRALAGAAPPIVMGHEFCAGILEHGPGTTARLPAGTRVVSVPYAGGPSGPEGLGLSPVLSGAFAERMVLQESLLLPVPDGLPDDHAALTEPLAVGLHAVRAARPEAGQVALVAGCGPIGLAVIAALKAEGHGPVIAADYAPARRLMAERLGADVVVDPAASSPYGRWSDLGVTEHPPSPLLPAGLDRPGDVVAFECVGVPGVIQQIIDGVPRHARIVVVGACMPPDTITPVTAILKEVSLTFVYAYRQDEFAQALRLLATGQVNMAALVTGHVGLDGVARAFGDLREPGHHVKIIVQP